jgi:1,4-alpha-glucan branching enzyme
VVDDNSNSVLAWCRSGEEGTTPIIAVSNFTPVPRHGYRIGVPAAGGYRELLNTDAALYGGSNLGNGGWVLAEEQPSHGLPYSIELILPPLATVLLRHAG